MRITDKSEIIKFNSYEDLETQFEQEYKYYSKYNLYPTIDNKSCTSKHINLQVIVGYKCQNSCPFCIEKNMIYKVPEINEKGFLFNLNNLLDKLIREQRNYIDITITGGEPSLFCYQKKIWNILNSILVCYYSSGRIRNISLNSNGLDTNFIKDMARICKILKYINISRHSIKQLSFFQESILSDLKKHNNKITLQKVLFPEDDINSVLKYVDYYSDYYGFKSFSIRGMYGKSHYEHYNKIINEMLNNPDITFVQQKIHSFFLYYHLKYKDNFVRMPFALISQNKHENLIDNIQFYPDGEYGFNWDRGVN